MWSGGRLTTIQATARPAYLWPEIWGLSKAAQKKERHEWKRKLGNARRLRGIYFIHPEDGVQGNHQKREKKLETQMEAATLCKMGTKKRSNKSRVTDDETQGSNKISKTKHARIVEGHESSRKRLNSTPPNDHEGRVAERGFNSVNHNNLVRTFIPMPQGMKIPDAKAAVDKEW